MTFESNFTSFLNFPFLQSQFAVHNHVSIKELDAAAIELKYKNSKFSFIVVLPNKRTGLSELETNIKGYGLENIRAQMTATAKIILRLPKFKVEFGIDLREPLENVSILCGNV